MNRDDRGAASLLVVACVAILLLIGCALGVVAAMVRAHRAAQSAADLAALAGAAAHQRGAAACAAAGSVASANAASVDACSTSGDDVWVTVTVPGPHWLGQTADLSAEARAGPG
ncbi:MAG: Rv3654c family TadE-like protein [Marmoricola sp.]